MNQFSPDISKNTSYFIEFDVDTFSTAFDTFARQ